MDPSSFYRLNEELASELARLVSSGALGHLQALLAASGSELALTSLRPREGLEELLGVLRPGAQPELGHAGPSLPPEDAPEEAEGCGCVEPEELSPQAGEPGGFDFASYLCARSRFVVEGPSGPREVYMPDHVCPRCLNEEGNVLESCARVCTACTFTW